MVEKEMNNLMIPKSSLLAKLPILFIGIGIAALVYWSTLFQLDQGRAIFGYLFSFVSVLTLLLGSLIFILIQHVTRAGWSVVIRRVPETVVYLFPIFILLFLPIAFFRHEIFPWTHVEHLDAILEKKQGYLNDNFFLIRSFGYLILWSIMGIWFYRSSLAQDTSNKFNITKINQALSAPGIIIYGLTLTFASFDWIMSLQPHWYSTIFGVYFFAGSLLFALAFMTLMAMLLQVLGILTVITDEHYHDLGKLLFGFTIFWAYIGFSQFMLYWYGNIPEEIEFYTHRMHHGWDKISWALPITNFFLPFFGLMSRALKRVKLVLAINCIWVIAVHLVDIYWMIMPAYHDPNVHEGPMYLEVSMVDVLSLLGIFSLFFGAFLFILSRHKISPVGDPRFNESLAFENF
jgi:hypothetical protein